ncbi:TolC family outer membrane protein [Rhodovulum sp. P5]|uniref:TolC family outer membrane protein n=1 Tax=Rhodovulum sp. P5 TaxID=1564506 RepID=UPI0009D9DCD3|nr:TolC family outer membrane protein [Rhodovulum sp. P5]
MSRIVGRLSRAALAAAALTMGPMLASAETLSDALIDAYKNSHLLEQNRAVLRSADEDVAQALAGLRPVIDFTINAGYGQTNVNPETTSSIDTYSRTATAELTAQLTLYDHGRTRLAIDAAKEVVLATRAGLMGVEQDILLNTVQAYMDVFASLESVRVAENNVRVLTTALRATRDRFEVGEVTRTDVSLAESRLAAGRSNLVAAQGSLATAREAFKLAVGRYPGALSGLPRLPQIPKTSDALRDLAVRSHPDILQAQHNVTASELNLARAKANYGPTITGSASVSASESSSGLIRRDSQDASLGITLNQRLYAGGGLYAAERQARAGVQQARAGLLQNVRLIDQEAGNAWASLAVARAQIEATARQVEAAQLAFEGTEEEARLGARTTLDVLDAEQELLDARIARIEAQTSQYKAVYSVLAAAGLMTVKHLGLGIPTYDPLDYYNAVSNAPAKSIQGRKLDRVLEKIGRN